MEQPTDLPGGGPAAEPAAPRRWSGLLRSVALPAALLALILGGLWYWDSRGGGEYADDALYGVVELPAAKNATGESPRGEIGRAAPDFLLEQPGGGTLRLSDLQGGPVLVNFFASWCPPCRAEMPELVDADARYRERGLTIVGVDLQEPDRKVLDFAEDFGIEFELVVDREGELRGPWRLGGPVQGIPSSYFIDAKGVIRDIHYGPMRQSTLDEKVGLILPETPG
jgi:peroxiredoxin